MNPPMAMLQLQARPEDGSDHPVVVQLALPRQEPAEPGIEPSWGCELTLDPLLPQPIVIYGADGLQALALAGGLAMRTLDSFIDRGGQLRHPGGEPWDAASLSEAHPFSMATRRAAL
jgi:hypothetical protein